MSAFENSPRTNLPVTNLHEPNPQPAHLPIDLIFSLPIFASKCTALFFLHKIVFATVTTDNICSTRRCRFVNLRTCAYRRHPEHGCWYAANNFALIHLAPSISRHSLLPLKNFSPSVLLQNTRRPTITRHPSAINWASII